MELLQLRYFRTAAMLENFSKAAAQYRLPPSAISRTVARLEQELGVRLFDRQGKRVSLSENGRLFLSYVSDALDKLDEGAARLTQDRTETIYLSLRAGSRLMPEVLAGFRRQHPHLSFALARENEPHPGDTCTICSLPVPEGFRYRRLLTEKLALAVPLSHPLAEKEAVELAGLRQESFVCFSKGKSLRTVVDNLFQNVGFAPHISFECDDPATLRGLVENGFGLALVPQKTWSYQQSDKVRLLPIRDITAERSLLLAWDAAAGISDILRQFGDYCVEWFASF